MAVSPAFAAADRISELPEEIIHLILRSLPYHEEAAKTSILSRRWLHIWRSYPLVEFEDRPREIDIMNSRFQSFAAATSKRLQAVPFLLDSFTITISLQGSENVGQGFYQLLSSASLGFDDDGGRSPLKVVLKINSYLGHSLEGRMLFNCGRTKFLLLKGFDLSRLHSFKTCLDNLQDLSLENVWVRKQSFPSFLANARRLEKLSLKYIFGMGKLDFSASKTCLHNLQELSLEYVRVNEQSFPSCLARVRRLEKLSLENIYGIDRLEICASNFPSLTSLSFHGRLFSQDGELRALQLSSALFLQTFRFGGKSKLLTVLSAPNVTSVELAPLYGELSLREFDDLISKFPSLESLDLDTRHISSYNRHRNRLRISAHTLRKLTLKQWKRNIELEIDAPNLETLLIVTDEVPINVNIVNIVASSTSRCVVDCSISEFRLTTYWPVALRKCLAALATRFHHLVFKLNFRPDFTEVFKLDSSKVGCEAASPLTVQHLLLGIDLPSEPAFEDETRLLDGILSAFRPETLLIAQPLQNRSLLSYISEQMKRRNHRHCCRNGQCWRRQFEFTKITSVTADDISTLDKPAISQPSINMILKMPREIPEDVHNS